MNGNAGINEKITGRLLTAQPWVRYRTRLDLLGAAPDDSAVLEDRRQMLGHPCIQSMINELQEWPGKNLTRHNDAGHPIHQLVFLADLGCNRQNPGIAAICEKIFATQAADGPFQVILNIPVHFGGSGQDQLSWMLCDAPLTLYALVKFGYGGDPKVVKAVDHLVGLVRDNGWPCAAAGELGRFRGPGRKSDPCPYATLVMIKLLAELPQYKKSEAAQTGLSALFDLWENRKSRKPYLFGMGTDFKKLKAPFIWYDILHVLDVVTRYPGTGGSPAVQEMTAVLESKKDGDGFFTAESVYRAWKEWDFGQKKSPSSWLTLLCHRILQRV